ncbi:MAG: tetratricopeptide repeat protein, partial [SAR324 cluster bacterium]|nr:tetratricopeptide repeat protein [SAR324 cluster bacterium]
MCSLRIKIVVVVISFFVSFTDAISQEQVLAQLESCEGVVMRQISGRGAFQAIGTGTLLRSSDVIQTGRNSRAAISFRDGGFLRIAENSSLQLEAKSGSNSNSKVIMPFGRAYYFSREPKAAPDFETPSVTTAIHGTEFALESNQNTTNVSVLDGSVRLTNPMGQLSLSSGEQGRASKDSAPLKTILIKPLDAVQWALYYPTLLSVSDLTKLKEAASKEEAFAISALEQGQKTAAISMLENAPDTGNPEIDLLKASLYVEQGDVTKAQALISSLNSKDDPAYSNTFKARLSALNAIILVAQNNKEEAQQLAATAYALDPKTPEALLARSYTSQASFEIKEAYEWAKKLAELLPNNSFAHARLAELEMGFGRNEEALKQAKQAMELDSNNSYALTVYGFSNLFRRMPDKAIESFEKAILNDGISSLPLLGLGLAKINKGLLADGRRDIEKAAFLAPQVAIYRSYLGKAFFEEEREGLAGHEYDRAISLDPLDPTSYLYRAYNQLSANDPVQALKDVEKSIELNNNRAIYRSSLLLDQDLAVRSAGLSETFTSLGFSQAARVEAIKSINKDYSNYSAHLLLADSYEMILTSDASTSEKALVDLLAPLSFNLFQRQAGDASLNEYNALFDRPDQRTGVLTSASTYNDRIAPQIQHAAKGEDSAYAFSLGSELTKGSKHNNFSRLNRARLLGSYQFDADNRALLEGVTTYYDLKELNMSPDQKEDEDFTIRSGYQHHLNSNSQLIADFGYSQIRSNSLAHSTLRQTIWNEIINGESFQRDYDILMDELSREALRLFRGNIQHIYDSEIVSLISGFHGQATHTLRKENSPVLEDPD